MSGCSSTESQSRSNENVQLKQQIAHLEKKVQTLDSELTSLKSKKSDQPETITINYQTYEFKKRFVQKESNILALPRKGSVQLRRVESNSVVHVLDAATADNQELWLYVSVPVYDSPSNNKGWISESDTVPLTKDNQKMVQSEVTVKARTKVYMADEFNKVSSTPPTKLSSEQRGRLEERKGGYARISAPGGLHFWVEEALVVYPSID